ncbi:MAG: hypothetical protein AVDCRST_MAG17-2335 [uncultured Solirubrobacterales bacterium]|uniref:Uncharacterized protein n=1 Tax=uncultured Solirubrobacterales bacterium TaxID=768556 RepID=A0A6J4T8T4_9ACTN|nr:MAG: hypothetical protein AVDCRST_MAG17-2335 [uncultured Solirubrobacterales bacterium]
MSGATRSPSETVVGDRARVVLPFCHPIGFGLEAGPHAAERRARRLRLRPCRAEAAESRASLSRLARTRQHPVMSR